MVTYKTIQETTQLWVSQFNCFPTDMIQTLHGNGMYFEEITLQTSGYRAYEYFPMWGWMWQFYDSIDDWWLEEGGGLAIMSELGFRVYESQEYGYFFGIDGAGYDFYETHWIPLYRARGLQWHDESDVV